MIVFIIEVAEHFSIIICTKQLNQQRITIKLNLCTPCSHVLCGIERYSIVVCHPIKRTNQIFCGSPDDNETYINTIQYRLLAALAIEEGLCSLTSLFKRNDRRPFKMGSKSFSNCIIFSKS